MKRRTVLAGVPLALAGCLDAFDGPDADAAAQAILAAINDERAAVGVGSLAGDDRLKSAAIEHSRDMAARDFYDHQNPDGQEPWDRVGCQAGENIHGGDLGRMQNVGQSKTWNTREPDELAGYVAEGWLNSRGHYENMIDSRWSAVGIGVHIADGEFLVTAKFC